MFQHLHRSFLSTTLFLGNFILTNVKSLRLRTCTATYQTIIHKINERKESLRNKWMCKLMMKRWKKVPPHETWFQKKVSGFAFHVPFLPLESQWSDKTSINYQNDLKPMLQWNMLSFLLFCLTKLDLKLVAC